MTEIMIIFVRRNGLFLRQISKTGEYFVDLNCTHKKLEFLVGNVLNLFFKRSDFLTEYC